MQLSIKIHSYLVHLKFPSTQVLPIKWIEWTSLHIAYKLLWYFDRQKIFLSAFLTIPGSANIKPASIVSIFTTVVAITYRANSKNVLIKNEHMYCIEWNVKFKVQSCLFLLKSKFIPNFICRIFPSIWRLAWSIDFFEYRVSSAPKCLFSKQCLLLFS